MITITQQIQAADSQAAFDIVEAAEKRGDLAELLEASRALRAKLRQRQMEREILVAEVSGDRYLNGSISRLAQHAQVPMRQVVSVILKTE